MVRLYLLHRKNQKGSKELSLQLRKQPVAVSRCQRSKPADHSHYTLTCLHETVSTLLCTPGKIQKCGANKAYLISIKSFLKTANLPCPFQYLSSCSSHCPCPFTFLSSCVPPYSMSSSIFPSVFSSVSSMSSLDSRNPVSSSMFYLSFLFRVLPPFTLP